MEKQLFTVKRETVSVQYKYVWAANEDEAQEIANHADWMEKEEVLDSVDTIYSQEQLAVANALLERCYVNVLDDGFEIVRKNGKYVPA